jgi:hypothetical protein
MHEIRRTAAIGRIDVAHLEVQVIRHAESILARRIACAEVTVHVVFIKPRVF